MHGVLNLIKPPGMTSHDAVAFARRVLQEKRIGHTGTLDPAAAGVLPICVGQATRLVEYLQAGTKEYIAEATFGYETDTLDAVGQTIREAPAAHINLELINAALEKFRGEIEQTPPLYSAIKKDGQKLYDIARAGGDIEIESRKVTISHLEVTRFVAGERPRAFIKIECSGGTYIRSLVRDIGKALGSAGTMTFLVRSRSGGFLLENAISCEEFETSRALISFEEALSWCARSTTVSDEAALQLLQGRLMKAPAAGSMEVSEKELPEGANKKAIIVRDTTRTVFALAVPSRETGFYRAEKVFDLRVK